MKGVVVVIDGVCSIWRFLFSPLPSPLLIFFSFSSSSSSSSVAVEIVFLLHSPGLPDGGDDGSPEDARRLESSHSLGQLQPPRRRHLHLHLPGIYVEGLQVEEGRERGAGRPPEITGEG